MSFKHEFAKRLISERKRLGMTQAEFAKACGVTPASHFLYEKAQRSPNSEYIHRAMLLGVRIDYLFGGIESLEGISRHVRTLRSLYKEANLKSRDVEGRLLDLEYQLDTFEDLILSLGGGSS